MHLLSVDTVKSLTLRHSEVVLPVATDPWKGQRMRQIRSCWATLLLPLSLVGCPLSLLHHDQPHCLCPLARASYAYYFSPLHLGDPTPALSFDL